MQNILNLLAWLFIICGLIAYSIGWIALMKNISLGVPTEFWFYDSLATGIFGLFFLISANQTSRKRK